MTAGEIKILTPSEQRAIEELKRGGSIKEMAVRLAISPNTLKERLKTIYTKLEVHSARELLVKLYVHPQLQKTDGANVLGALEAVLDAPTTLGTLHAVAVAVTQQVGGRAGVFLVAGEAPRWRLRPVEAEPSRPGPLTPATQPGNRPWRPAGDAAPPAPPRDGAAGALRPTLTDFIAETMRHGEAISERAVRELPNWNPPLLGIRLDWRSGRALLVLSKPHHEITAVECRRAALLARFAEAVLAQPHPRPRASGAPLPR